MLAASITHFFDMKFLCGNVCKTWSVSVAALEFNTAAGQDMLIALLTSSKRRILPSGIRRKVNDHLTSKKMG